MRSLLSRTLVSAAAAGAALLASVASAQTFSNVSPIVIPNSGVAAPYPSTIGVAGGPASIGSMTVTLANFSHTFPQDVAVMLVGPTGASTILMSRPGSGADAVNATLVFRDGATPLPTPTGGPVVSGDFAPTRSFGATFSAPAPATPTTAALSTFTGTNANGTWSLYVQDVAGPDSGSFAGEWSISFFPVPPAVAAQDSSFTYQGKLESGAAVVSGVADFRFSLWSTAADATPTGQIGGTLVRSAVPVTDGLFTTSLDFGFGVADNKSLFLQIEVRSPAGSGAFTTLTPRQPLAAAINAQFARNADNATGLNSDGRIFIGGTASPDDNNSPGLWLRSPAITGTDRAFIGLRNDTRVGFFSPSAGWSSLVVNTATGNTMLGADADASARLEVNGSTLIRTGTAAAPNVLAFGPYSAAVGAGVEQSDSMGIFRVNSATNVSELRVHIGDDPSSFVDSLVVGINPGNVWTPVYNFFSNGVAQKAGGGAWAVLSDPRKKHDIAPLSGTLDKVLRLRGYSFVYNDDALEAHQGLPGTQIGLMADEVAGIFPDWVSTNNEGTRFVTERSTTALMVEALRDLRTEKDEQIKSLKADNAELKARLAKIEAMLGEKAAK